MFSIEAEIRDANRRTAREARSPVVVYDRGGSHGTAHLANIGDYLLTVGGWPPDYSKARIVHEDDLPSIQAAERILREARKAAQKLYAIAFAHGLPITEAAADAAKRQAKR